MKKQELLVKKVKNKKQNKKSKRKSKRWIAWLALGIIVAVSVFLLAIPADHTHRDGHVHGPHCDH